MRLSDAIMLGSTAIRWVGGISDDGHGGGCALGMATVAMGKTYEDGRAAFGKEMAEWLFNSREPVVLPCGCKASELIGSGNNMLRVDTIQQSYAGVLVHLFNFHVMMAKDWTLEQVCDWVRTYEPTEAKPKIEQAQEVPAQAAKE